MEFRKRDCTVYKIFVGDKVVSRAEVVDWKPEVGEILSVWTHPDYRNEGYATELIKKISEDFKKVMFVSENEYMDKLAKKLCFEKSNIYEKCG